MTFPFPRPGDDYNGGWGSQFTKSLEDTLQDLGQPIAVNWKARGFHKTRFFNAGSGTSAVGQVGTVTVSTNGSISTQVQVTGVGGAAAQPTRGEIAQVLATLISDMKTRGSLG